MRLAVTGCSDRLAHRLRSALRGHEVIVETAGGPEPETASDLILVSSGGRAGPDVMSCAERVRALRRRHPSLPILAVTNGPPSDGVVDILDAGADAVVTRPLDEDELRLRIRGLLRRSARGATQVLQYRDLQLSRLRHTASGPAGPVLLTPREHQILQYLMLNAERVVGRDEIQDAVWGSDRTPSANVLDVHLSHVRTKLAGIGVEGLVHTLRGVGLFFGTVLEDGPLGPRGPGRPDTARAASDVRRRAAPDAAR